MDSPLDECSFCIDKNCQINGHRAEAGVDKPEHKVSSFLAACHGVLAKGIVKREEFETRALRFNAGDDNDLPRVESGGRDDKDSGRRGSVTKARPSHVYHAKPHVALHTQATPSQSQSVSSSSSVKQRRGTRRFSLPKAAVPLVHNYPHRSDFASTGADGPVDEDEDATDFIQNALDDSEPTSSPVAVTEAVDKDRSGKSSEESTKSVDASDSKSSSWKHKSMRSILRGTKQEVRKREERKARRGSKTTRGFFSRYLGRNSSSASETSSPSSGVIEGTNDDTSASSRHVSFSGAVKVRVFLTSRESVEYRRGIFGNRRKVRRKPRRREPAAIVTSDPFKLEVDRRSIKSHPGGTTEEHGRAHGDEKGEHGYLEERPRSGEGKEASKALGGGLQSFKLKNLLAAVRSSSKKRRLRGGNDYPTEEPSEDNKTVKMDANEKTESDDSCSDSSEEGTDGVTEQMRITCHLCMEEYLQDQKCFCHVLSKMAAHLPKRFFERAPSQDLDDSLSDDDIPPANPYLSMLQRRWELEKGRRRCRAKSQTDKIRLTPFPLDFFGPGIVPPRYLDLDTFQPMRTSWIHGAHENVNV